MDDIIFQSSNPNSVYVLNSNYRYYENFARLNLIEPNDVISKNQSYCQHASLTSSGHRSCTRPTQYKLRHFGKFCDVPEAIGSPVTTAPTTTINPPASTCLASTDVLQKFFNRSYVTNAGGCDSLHSLHTHCYCGRAAGACTDPNSMQNTCKNKPNNNNKKKNINLKPSLIAKKTKFRKFIEEEKWKTGDECILENEYQNNHNVRVEFTGSSTPTEFRTNSSVKESNTAESTTLTASMAAMATCGPLNNIVKHYWNGKMEPNATGRERKKHQQQNQSNNWSGSGDSNNQQHQAPQQLEVLKSTHQQKTNYELYKEAADLLGLPCTLCDNCRCLECQSSYFDCDDSDSLSEVSNSDEYDEDTRNVFNNSVELVMYANCYSDNTMTGNEISTIQQRQQQKGSSCFQERRLPNFTCHDVNCNAREFGSVDQDSYNLVARGGDEAANGIERIDIVNQNVLHSVQCNELENCSSFNGLSLRDANIEMPLGTGSESRG